MHVGARLQRRHECGGSLHQLGHPSGCHRRIEVVAEAGALRPPAISHLVISVVDVSYETESPLLVGRGDSISVRFEARVFEKAGVRGSVERGELEHAFSFGVIEGREAFQ